MMTGDSSGHAPWRPLRETEAFDDLRHQGRLAHPAGADQQDHLGIAAAIELEHDTGTGFVECAMPDDDFAAEGRPMRRLDCSVS
jgi:hypothetical protein